MHELRSLYHTYAAWALVTAVAMHLAVLGGYYLSQILGPAEQPVTVIRLGRPVILPPPSIMADGAPPQVSVSMAMPKASLGIPVPVPDAEVDAEQTIPSQPELGQTAGSEAGTGDGVIVAGPEPQLTIEEEPPDWVPVERLPVPIRQVAPDYPQVARIIGAEGTVWVRIWVSKEGRVRKAVIAKSENEVFDESALQAARQWLFVPAVMNSGPVAVWMTIPFRFTLRK
jgi:protein TonB